MDFIFTIILLFLKVLGFLVHPIYLLTARGKKRVVPAIKNDLLKISATELAEKIRRKELSSQELCNVYIERIKEVNPIINAVVEERFEKALQDAKNVDNYLSKSSLSEEELMKTKPLLGIPLTIKESCGLQGMEFSVGKLNRHGYKCDNDGELVSRLRSCGAIPLLVSNTPELCLCWESHNFITGTTNNPYDSTCTSGGSSGGEGALIGAGASIIGIGSDIAGSIRLPALFNGVFGHKPSPRIASIKGHYPSSHEEKFYDMMVIGPLTRYAQDLRLMMNVIIDPPLKSKLNLKEKVDLKKIRVFYMQEVESIMIQSVQKEIQQAVEKAVEYLKTKCGATVVEHKFHEFKDALQVCGKLLFSIREFPNPLKGTTTSIELEFFKSIMGHSQCTPNIIYFLLLQKIFDNIVTDHNLEAAMWKKSFTDILGEDGVFIYPTSTTSASKHHEFYFTIPTVAYTIVPSALGLPATSVPCGLDKNGLPIGIQVIAAANQDRLCLTVAEELEKCFGGWIPPKMTM